MSTFTFEQLNKRHRAERDGYCEALSLRVHRALSWLKKAESCEDDDSRFIFLWIAFNAAYACDLPPQYKAGEKQAFDDFMTRLCKSDQHEHLKKLVWQSFTGPIRVLLNNHFVFQPFWDHQNGKISEEQWKQDFSLAKRAASKALGENNTPKLLSIVLFRIYTLRNQLVHGGATYSGGLNRQPLKDCTKLMGALVPRIITIMMDSSQTLWGEPYFPVIKK